MKTVDSIALDYEMEDRHYKIYEADGVRGTLKELSDYFCVDPISVSNLLADGNTIQDALCLADKAENCIIERNNVRGAEKMDVDVKDTKLLNDYTRKLKPYIEDIFNEYISDPKVTYISLARKYGVSGWTIGKNILLYAKNTGQMDVFDLAKASRSGKYIGSKNVVENHVNKIPEEEKSYVPVNKKEKIVKDCRCNVNDQISTKSVTDVQDLGDIVVITTTTTFVYRKG